MPFCSSRTASFKTAAASEVDGSDGKPFVSAPPAPAVVITDVLEKEHGYYTVCNLIMIVGRGVFKFKKKLTSRDVKTEKNFNTPRYPPENHQIKKPIENAQKIGNITVGGCYLDMDVTWASLLSSALA